MLPEDLISVNEAAQLVTSPRGKRTHLSTIWRWIVRGRLRGYRVGHYAFVSRAEILALLRPVPLRVEIPRTKGELLQAAEDRELERREASARLDALGI